MGETIRPLRKASTPQASVVGGIIWTPIHIEKGSTMIRQALVAAAALALAVPAVAIGDSQPSPASLATQTCKAEQVQAATFKLTYGTNATRSNAFGRCVAKHTATSQQDLQTAAKQCKAEQDADATAFAKKYGSNTQAKGKGAGADAFGKCVSAKASGA